MMANVITGLKILVSAAIQEGYFIRTGKDIEVWK